VVILGWRNREIIPLLPRLSVAASGHLWCQNSYPPRDISVRAWSDVRCKSNGWRSTVQRCVYPTLFSPRPSEPIDCGDYDRLPSAPREPDRREDFPDGNTIAPPNAIAAYEAVNMGCTERPLNFRNFDFVAACNHAKVFAQRDCNNFGKRTQTRPAIFNCCAAKRTTLYFRRSSGGRSIRLGRRRDEPMRLIGTGRNE
jgi:hypothetical protein